MKALIIIRTYPIDDFISFLCYRSFKNILPHAKFIFFAQREEDPPPGKYKWIRGTGEEILFRGYCCNFGGRSHVRACVEGLKQIDTNGYDKILFVDADVLALANPIEEEFEFGGVQHKDYPRLFSGQCLIFSKDIFDKVVNYPSYEELYEEFINDNYRSISDDTIFSWIATSLTTNTFNFAGREAWLHKKFHFLEP